jgi:enamine deaminase RidA (YjgF/YER057c/UK114 family)
MTDALAFVPRRSDCRAFAVSSPLQCSPGDYGSSFSRAVELASPSCRRLLVSGTAGIDSGGQTVHVGDVAAQIELTMRVVSAILESRRMSWSDAVRCIVYFKRAEDAPAFETYCRVHGLDRLPLVLTENDICRGELLFEIQVDALTAD